AFNVGKNKFTVAIIPYTIEHTNLAFLQEDATVNVEFDILGKYVQRALG
ncbi:MAG: riboflavin synthase, partial [Chitinophagaceae bacterium]|nr:riboflavin synthase [Chitinophagaceae bacterium]